MYFIHIPSSFKDEEKTAAQLGLGEGPRAETQEVRHCFHLI